jgi:hypothetical protein
MHQPGYMLHTASGACSLDLASLMYGMGARSYFGRRYGADLINTFKNGSPSSPVQKSHQQHAEKP